MAPHSSVLAWRILWTRVPGGLLSMGSYRVGHSWSDLACMHACMHALEKEMATHSSVLAWRIPGTAEPGGLPSMESQRVGHDWSDLATAAAKAMVFPVTMYGCESWTIKKAECQKNWFWIVVLEKTLESPLDCKEIKLVNPKANQSWIFIGRTDAEAETTILWSPDAKKTDSLEKPLMLGKI